MKIGEAEREAVVPTVAESCVPSSSVLLSVASAS